MSDDLDYHDAAIRVFTELQVGLWDLARAVLVTRPGWSFEVEEDSGLPLWRFGERGAARLVLTVQYDKFLIYDADNDKEWPTVADGRYLALRLEKLEPEHAGLSEAQINIAGDVIASDAKEMLRELDRPQAEDDPGPTD